MLINYGLGLLLTEGLNKSLCEVFILARRCKTEARRKCVTGTYITRVRFLQGLPTLLLETGEAITEFSGSLPDTD